MKNDQGFKESEKMLNDLEKKIHEEYARATKEMTEKVDAYFSRFKEEDAKKREDVESGKMTKAEYKKWRVRKMATGEQYKKMRDTLAKDLTNTDKIAMSYVNDKIIDVYALNMNYGTYSIEHDSKIDTSFTLYNHDAVERLIRDNPQLLPLKPDLDVSKDLLWNKQHINSAITQGILQGKSIPKIAKSLQNVTGMDERAAIRNARTAMTGAQNGGRMDSMKRAQARGIAVKKGWMATLDHVTRDSHVDLDGEVQDLDKPFSNGLMYPADTSNYIPAEIYNCRCRLTHEYDKYKTDWTNLENRRHDKLGNMSYDEWKNRHRSTKKATKVSDLSKATQETLYNYTTGNYNKVCEYSQYIVNGDADLSPSQRTDTKEKWEQKFLSDITPEEKEQTEIILNTILDQPVSEEKLVRLERGINNANAGDVISFGVRSTSADTSFIDKMAKEEIKGFDYELMNKDNNGLWTEYRFMNSKNLDLSDISPYKDQNERIIAGRYKVLSVEVIKPVKAGFEEIRIPVKDIAENVTTFVSKKSGKTMVRFNYDGKERIETPEKFETLTVTDIRSRKAVFGRKIITLEIEG